MIFVRGWAFAKRRAPELAGVLIAFSAVTTLICANEYRVQANAVQRTLFVKNALASLLSSLQDAETGQRGYLLTGNEAFLQPYRDGKAQAAHDFDEVKQLTTDSEDQQTRLKSLEPIITQKVGELANRIALLRAGTQPTIEQLQVGKAAMDQIRKIIADMNEDEDRLLGSRSAKAQWLIGIAAAFEILTALLAVGGMGVWVWQSRQLTSDLRNTISQRDLAESKARQLQKLEAIGQLTGGIAHDFNNILAVITAGLSLLLRRAQTLDDARPFVIGALDAAKRGSDLTRRLLAFSRQSPLEPRTIDINRWVSDVADVISRAVGETIQTETVLGAGAWPVHVDPNELQNALLNIAINARDAMPDGGRLTIETANMHFDDRYSLAHEGIPEGQYVLIAISDTGSGMAKATVDKAFEPFFTTKPTGKGTGLGLSQVHGFVKQSAGHVKIYSELGAGTTIKLYFPRAMALPDHDQPQQAASESIPRGDPSRLVLVVEDDPRVRAVSVALMRELGYSVVHADGPSTALVKLEKFAGIELMFTDIVMPEMNGRQLADLAVQRRPDLKVLYTTGFTRNAVVHGGVLDRGVHLIPKPFTIEQLARKVHEVLS